MSNSIALLLRPSRAFLLCFGLLVGYGVLMLGSMQIDDSPVTDASDVSCVELLR
jgi:hypothetical protein